jgi:hypothetical protein
MAIHLLPAGGPVPVEPKNARTFTLPELNALVGGYIEVVPLAKGGTFMVVNEDGKRLQLPVNPHATALLREAGGYPGDCVVGNVVICTYAELEGDEEVEE